jgi:hypothetical protein
MSRIKALVFALVVLTILTLLYFRLRGAQVVDSRPAIAAAGSYYLKLEHGQLEMALKSYSDIFREKHGAQWKDLLQGQQEKYGNVTRVGLKGSAIVPLSSGLACTLLIYDVQRERLSTTEKLVICPDRSSGVSIVGHQLSRNDTHQHVSAGTMVQTSGGQ